MSALHQPPIRPVVDGESGILNPLTDIAPIKLDDTKPLAYADLTPNARYVSHGLEYYTDGHALPARVRGSLRLVPVGERIRHPMVQAAAGRLAATGSGTYQGGHIVAVSLGGFASGPNLFPQQHNFNISAYARLEQGWRGALADGVSVEVDIALTLDHVPTVPHFVIVTYWEDGEEWQHPLLNEPNAQ